MTALHLEVILFFLTSMMIKPAVVALAIGVSVAFRSALESARVSTDSE